MAPDNDTTTGREEPAGAALTDATFRALRHPVRRFVIRYLREHERADIDTLATVVTGHRSANSGQIQDRADRETARLLLIHRHLPTLEAAGIVEHDRETGRITLESVPEPTTRLLEQVARRETESGEADQ